MKIQLLRTFFERSAKLAKQMKGNFINCEKSKKHYVKQYALPDEPPLDPEEIDRQERECTRVRIWNKERCRRCISLP